jgi:hypothetical protein
MQGVEVDRALKRPGEYFFEDGLGEIVVGLWIGLTVALPQLIFGSATGDMTATLAWAASFSLRPAILAAKERWVYPRTGRVAYDPENMRPSLASLGLSPATRPAAGPTPGQWTTVLSYFLPGTLALLVLLGIEQSRRLGIWGAGGHLLMGSLLSSWLLLAWWRWRQRRWMALALALALLAAAVASSRLEGERALALHAAGVAGAILASGTLAFVSYLHHAPKPVTEADGQ